jgi:hypothetical protein
MAKLILPETKTDPLIHKKINKVPVNNDSIEAITPDTDKKVVGTFVNIECPGQPAKICAKLYKGMQYFNEVLEDSKQYTIPWSVARFINERVNHEKHSYLTDPQGNPIKENKKTPRYKFMIEQFV